MKIICSDYEAKGHGSSKCRSYCGMGLCSVRDRLRCIQWLCEHQDETNIEELLSFPEFSSICVPLKVGNRTGGLIEISAEAIPEFASNLLRNLPGVYSFSQLCSYQTCPRKWYLQYVKRVKEIERKHYFEVGSAGHAILEAFLSGMSVDTAIHAADEYMEHSVKDGWYQYRLAAIQGIAMAWCEEHKHLVCKGSVEKYIEHPHIPIRAYVDFVRDMDGNRVQLWEHKFPFSCEYLPKYKAQTMLYKAICEDLGMEVDSAVINVMKKPNPQRGFTATKGESLDHYRNRVFESVKARPDDWMKEYRLDPTQDEIEDFKQQLIHTIDQIEEGRRAGWHKNLFPRNYDACTKMGMQCEFYHLCESGRVDPTVYRFSKSPTARKDGEEQIEKEAGSDGK